jgi:phage protein D
MSAPTLMNVVTAQVKVNGTAISDVMYTTLIEIVVDQTINAATMLTVRFDDPNLEIVNASTFVLGATLEILVSNDTGTYVSLGQGEVTSVEPEFDATGRSTLLVRALHKVHRLNFGRVSKTFQQVTDSAIITQLINLCGASPTVESTTYTHQHVFQWNQTNMEFMLDRMRRTGLIFVCDGANVTVRKPSAAGASVATLEYGNNFTRAAIRSTVGNQVGNVEFASWDQWKKEPVVAQGKTPAAVRSIGDSKLAASSKLPTEFGTITSRFLDVSLTESAPLETALQSYVTELGEGLLSFECECPGLPTLVAGKKVNLTNVGTRFSGSYLITTARHVVSEAGYTTYIYTSGYGASTFANLVGEESLRRRVDGVMVGIVTNNTENGAPDGKSGRVRVKFPTLSDADESWWARLASPMSGKDRGIFFYPEVNDEVVVGFEDGDPNRAYVLGSVWNGKDTTPLTAAAAVVDSKVEKRIIKTRIGHFVEFNDTKDAEAITIQDKGGNKVILFAKSGNEKITIEATKDMDIKVDNGTLKITAKIYDLAATQTITQKSDQKSLYEATQDLELKSSANIKGTATADITFAATANFKATATANVELSSTATTKITASAPMELSSQASMKVSSVGMTEVSGAAMLKLGGAMINIG